MVYLILGLIMAVLSAVLRLAAIFRLAIPLIYALVVPTVFHEWYYANQALILVIAVACFGTETFQYILGTSHGVSHTFPFMNWGYPAALRHVQGFPLLRLLRRLRCPAGYSGPAAIAINGVPV